MYSQIEVSCCCGSRLKLFLAPGIEAKSLRHDDQVLFKWQQQHEQCVQTQQELNSLECKHLRPQLFKETKNEPNS